MNKMFSYYLFFVLLFFYQICFAHTELIDKPKEDVDFQWRITSTDPTIYLYNPHHQRIHFLMVLDKMSYDTTIGDYTKSDEVILNCNGEKIIQPGHTALCVSNEDIKISLDPAQHHLSSGFYRFKL